MKKDINGETDFEDLVLQIKDAVDNVTAQNPYTDQQVVSIAFTIVERCGFYPEDCRDWKRNAADTKTWPNFKTHFSRAFKEVREAAATVKIGGYSNICKREVAELAVVQEAANNETDQAITNFVSAASADRTTIISLTKTIADISTEFFKANAAIAALTKKMDNGKNHNNAGSDGDSKKKRKLKKLITDIYGVKREFKRNDDAFYDPTSYCWTHGFRCRIGHNSTTCGYKNEGHIDTATRSNTQGGNQSKKNWK